MSHFLRDRLNHIVAKDKSRTKQAKYETFFSGRDMSEFSFVCTFEKFVRSFVRSKERVMSVCERERERERCVCVRELVCIFYIIFYSSPLFYFISITSPSVKASFPSNLPTPPSLPFNPLSLLFQFSPSFPNPNPPLSSSICLNHINHINHPLPSLLLSPFPHSSKVPPPS